MKKSVLFIGLLGLLVWVMTACEPKEEPFVEKSFPKKHLLEEFTGQDCVYCPYGMDCVHDFIGNDTNWIVILHHYGYKADHFSIAGSKNITGKLGVNGAPTIAINRSSTQSDYGKKICFHPGYLPSVDRSQFATSTYASIVLENTYDADSRLLKVHVSGDIGKEEVPKLKLTLMVKESGMIDYQADYYTFEGWEEFLHANAVRAYLTDPLGDSISLHKHKYSADYTLTINPKWVPENCAVVAILSEDFRPVIQAEQQPVVAGTKGGMDILHGGIKPVPVSDYYPEPGTDIAPTTYSGMETDTINTAAAYYESYSQYGFKLWEVQAYDLTRTLTIEKTNCVPFADLFVFTDLTATQLPVGSYTLDTTMAVGTAYAGFRDDEHMQIDGSMFYYVSRTYLQQGYLVPSAQWLIVDGTLVITEEGWKLTGHARNGSEIHLVGSTPIKNGGPASAPRRAAKNNNILSISDKNYRQLWTNSL